MEGQAVIESIYLFSDQQEKVVQTSVEGELQQSSKLKGHTRSFRIFNGKYINSVFNPRFGRSREYWLDLSFLDPKPRRHFHIDWFLLGLTIVFSAIAALLVNLRLNPQDLNGVVVSMPIIIASFVLLLFSLTALILRFKFSLFFIGKHSRTPLLEFDCMKPNRTEFKAFVRQITERIEQRDRLDKGQELAGELREHRRLRDEAALEEHLYQMAKYRIFRAHSK